MKVELRKETEIFEIKKEIFLVILSEFSLSERVKIILYSQSLREIILQQTDNESRELLENMVNHIIITENNLLSGKELYETFKQRLEENNDNSTVIIETKTETEEVVSPLRHEAIENAKLFFPVSRYRYVSYIDDIPVEVGNFSTNIHGHMIKDTIISNREKNVEPLFGTSIGDYYVHSLDRNGKVNELTPEKLSEYDSRRNEMLEVAHGKKFKINVWNIDEVF